MKADAPYDKNEFSRQVGEQERRRLKALKETKKNIWSGLGLFGMVGWSVVVPTLLGAALGVWLDKRYPEKFSWTITCLITGLIAGCLIAWNWVRKEHEAMHKNGENNNEKHN